MSMPPMPTSCQLDSAARENHSSEHHSNDPFLTFSHAVYYLDILIEFVFYYALLQGLFVMKVQQCSPWFL